jgi:hypothetical protein
MGHSAFLIPWIPRSPVRSKSASKGGLFHLMMRMISPRGFLPLVVEVAGSPLLANRRLHFQKKPLLSSSF